MTAMPATSAKRSPSLSARLLRWLPRWLTGRRGPPYQEVLDAMEAGIVLYDTQDRLVLCNRNFRALYPGLAHRLVPGQRFEALVREAIALGLIPQARGHVEAFVAARVQQHLHPGPPLLRQMADGRWRRISEQRLADGSVLAFSIDVSELVEKERALDEARGQAQQAHERLEDAIEALPDGFALFDEDDRLVVCNQRYRDLYQLSAPAIRPGTTFEAILRYGLARGQYPAAESQELTWLEERLYRHRHADQPLLQELPGNRWLRIEERATRLGGVAGVRVDVTELVQREQQLKQLNARLADSRAQLHAVIGTALSAILMLDERGVVLSANPAAATIFGWTEEELVGRDLRVLVPADLVGHSTDPLALLSTRATDVRAARGAPQDIRARHRDGHAVVVQLALSRLETSGAARFVALFTDLSEREAYAQALRDASAQLALLSETDALTAIANRRRFDRVLQEEWQRSGRHGQPLALLLVDVDYFKRYNDSLGHPMGDDCLRAIAQVLRDCVRRAGDLVARYGGEEFALLLPHTGAAEAMALALTCIEAVEAAALPHPDSPMAPHVTLSIGVASMVATDAAAASPLVAAADAAVYAAKRAGRRRAVMAE
ncbi:diguanylate cyclase [uncultured Piscinibacter sp.]|uniref:sensor domain-containing diguanylate cyclase n=1 Tax=uncultured Piscinibacter sp. TaxID=1131835 RepID=UPI002603D55A|nr:diguanylate cyclase [uncultured Piscinibacter sp.]